MQLHKSFHMITAGTAKDIIELKLSCMGCKYLQECLTLTIYLNIYTSQMATFSHAGNAKLRNGIT